MANYVADFETTTNPKDCRVWAYAICEIGKQENIIIGNTLDDFMQWCMNRKENDLVFFHNLKFDSQFILSWLFKNGYTHTTTPEDRKSQTFSTMINSKGLYYQIEVIFKRKNKNINKVVFRDSMKLIPLSVEDIAESFKLPITKLKINYDAHNNLPEGADLTDQEKEYIKHDVQIVAYAMDYFFKMGYDSMTIGACALKDYKNSISNKFFKRYFPVPTYHDDVKQSYRGGFTFVNPKFAEKLVKDLIVLDINSMYPFIMYTRLLPYGTPIFFKGKYKEDPLYPLYTQMIECQFKLKEGKIPTVQLKYAYDYRGTEYQTTSGDVEVILCLNSVDLELFLEQYDVYNLKYLSGWKFKATKGLFKNYIEKWSRNKIQAKKEQNHGLYLISKLFLNQLYGKFGTDTRVKEKIPYIGDDGQVYFKYGQEQQREGVYIAMASFITSYGRKYIIESAQQIMDDYNAGKSNIQFVYADTDSLHCISPNFEKPQGLIIDDTKLGAFKVEAIVNRAKFIRSKCYMEEQIITEKDYIKGINSEDSYLYKKRKNNYYFNKITVSGMPDSCYRHVNFNNFKIGSSYQGKLLPRNVKGGVVLEEVDFTIQKL